jgi:hypothetical protein
MTDPRDDDLVALYRELPRAEPPAALDAAVLAAARAAVRARRPVWLAPAAAAAVMVLAVGVGWQLRHEPLRESTPPAAPATEAETTAEPAGEAAKAEQAVARQAEGAQAPQAVPTAPAPTPPAGAIVEAQRRSEAAATATRGDDRATAGQQRLDPITTKGSRVQRPRERTFATPPPESIAAPAADRAAAPPIALAPPEPPAPPVPSSASAPTALSAEPAPAAAARGVDPIASAIADIRALRDAGRHDEAVAALSRLLDEYPTLALPDDLRELHRPRD